MFALEIAFRDGVSQPETLFVRRPQALIGSSDYAHVVVEDLKQLDVQLRVVRDAGRRFRCKPLGSSASSIEMSSLLEGIYEDEATIDLGPVRFHFTALDIDLALRDAEPPDRGGVRVLRQACATPSPLFPAIALSGPTPMVISFVPDQPILIGRAKQCALRLDSADISAKHARIGFESGEFWVEDLGSTNGTFVNQQQISGRVNVAPGIPIVLGREITLIGVISADQIERSAHAGTRRPLPAVAERKYPVLMSVSEVARPARVVIQPGMTINIGRDPSSELWLGAPHVSRSHCSVSMSPTGAIAVRDSSTNGTAYDRGVLHKGDVLELGDDPCVLDFGGGVTLAVCFNSEQEQTFVRSQGDAAAFRPKTEAVIADFEEPDSQVLSEGRVAGKLSRRKAKSAEGRLSLRDLKTLLRFYHSLTPVGKLSIVIGMMLLGVVVVILVSLIAGLFKG